MLQYAEYGGPEVLRVTEIETPKPGPAEVLVRVHAATVGWGDCKLRSGSLKSFYHIIMPKIPGRYGSGIIAALGPGVTVWHVGQSVLFAPLHTESGSAAEYIRLSSGNIALKPAAFDHIQTASMMQGVVSAYSCLIRTGEVAVDQRVLVHGGAGSIGSACVELARHLGCIVTATCREIDCDYVRSLGAHHTVAFDRVDFQKTVQEQDVVIDLLGGDVHRKSYRVLRTGGRLIYLNADPIDRDMQRTDVVVLNAPVVNDGSVLQAVSQLIGQGVFAPRVGKVLPLQDGSFAHELLESRAIRRGRIVLKVTE